jgi:hypothetical protein
VRREYFRPTELVDRGRSHGVRNGAHIMFPSNDEAYDAAVHAERRPVVAEAAGEAR